MDDSSLSSSDQGTPNLCTVCHPGQTINWTIIAVDLQTPVAIRNITFGDQVIESPTDDIETESDKLHLNVWSGTVPYWLIPGVKYRYRLELQMYEGINSIMSIDTPSLRCI
jgi:hypothetical protein